MLASREEGHKPHGTEESPHPRILIPMRLDGRCHTMRLEVAERGNGVVCSTMLTIDAVHSRPGYRKVDLSVIASVLSYNSAATLPRVIEGIECQTRQPDRVLIIDNGSDEPTLRYLRQLPPRYEVIFLPENLGLGAGHNTGWRKALNDPECEYVWTLENDSIPPKECLQRLLRLADELVESGSPIGAICPRQVHPDVPHEPRQEKPRVTAGLTFNGTLIPASVIRQVGLLREDFFIDQDDWEFAHRLAMAELPIYVDPLTPIIHLGKGRASPSILRIYYRVRNATYLRKTIRKKRFAGPESVLRCSAAIVRTLIREDMKWRRIKARVVATRDGLRGDLGKKDYSFLRG